MSSSIIPILADQLSHDVAALRDGDRDLDAILMVESDAAARHVRYHKKKLAFLFSAMRHFAEELRKDGWRVRYVEVDDPANTGSVLSEIDRARSEERVKSIRITEPGNWSLRHRLSELSNVTILEDDRFLCSHSEFKAWADGRKQLRMEHFYRKMRHKTGLLMQDGLPEGGRWNFDQANRKRLPGDIVPPAPPAFEPDQTTLDILSLVAKRYPDHFGSIEPFQLATTRRQVEIALETFISDALPYFGDYQDAMTRRSTHLFHAGLSHYLNVGLLDPLEVCRKAEAAYHNGDAPLNAVEGFIRQIIGWREFVRGIYWREMPHYTGLNFFSHTRPLPEFYWDGKTDLSCLSAAITETRDNAYAHHIQRLMVTGNFALLAGVDPRDVHEWYLSAYIDAFEWVEVPNTLGMSQFADGGLLASKPYLSGGNYINRMSDYCAECRFDVKKRSGRTACPFNYLYWNFLNEHRAALGQNHRLAMAYHNWDRMPDVQKTAVIRDSQRFLDAL